MQQASPLALQALALLEDAASQGLVPADYQAGALRQALTRPGAVSPRVAKALEASLVRYLSDLRQGRVDPATLFNDQVLQARPKPEPWNARDFLDRHLAPGAAQSWDQAMASAQPTGATYAQLKSALATYRALAGHPAWANPLPAPPNSGVQRLEDWPGMPQLLLRLRALGDLDADADALAVAADPSVLSHALKGFQQRHGLQPDAVLGPLTWRALQVTPAQRARQILLNMERQRWRPEALADRWLEVNLPEFTLRAMLREGGGVQVQHAMAVVVGQASKHPTPRLLADLRQIELSPFWNVPYSIARDELLPQLRRTPALLAQAGYEFVFDSGQVQRQFSTDALDAVLAGQARLRQRPGPANAVGAIKFVMPNTKAIFLHHTPATQLFDLARRDFSHGCIRVQDPVTLALFVLQGQPEANEQTLGESMKRDKPRWLTVVQPLPVLITYDTVRVEGGQLRFFDDIYQLDTALDQALNRRPRPPLPAP